MRLKLNYSRPDGSSTDLHVTVDADCRTGDLARQLALSDPAGANDADVTLVRADRSGSVVIDPWIPVVDSGLQSGSSIALATAKPSDMFGSSEPVAILTVHGGPDAGRVFDLYAGPNSVGRDRQCVVQLSDPMVSMRHALIVVSDTVEIVDDNSSNGILIGGQQVSRVSLTPDDTVVLGENVLSVRRVTPTGPLGLRQSPVVEFNRSPRVDPRYEGPKLVAPNPPRRPDSQPFPYMSLVLPLIMVVGIVALMVVVAGGASMAMFFVFMIFSPIMMALSWFENRRRTKKAWEQACDGFRRALADLLARGRAAHDEERDRRMIEHPGVSEIVEAITNRGPLLWTRRPEHEGFGELRFGIGTQSSRLEIDVEPARESPPELVYELEDVTTQLRDVERVPIVASLDRSGSLGISGPVDGMLAVARGVVVQLVGLHSPAEVVVCAVTSPASSSRWDWLKWLPHTSSDHAPFAGTQLASTAPGCVDLISAIDDLVAARLAAADTGSVLPLPRVVLLVEDEAPIERSRLVSIAEIGPSVGVHLIWVAPTTADIPAACRSFLEIDPLDGTASTGRVVEAEMSTPVLVEPVSESDVVALAKMLSPVVDSGARLEDQSDLPTNVSFLSDAGMDLAETPDAIVARWVESQSVFPPADFPPGTPRPSGGREKSLRALVGRGKGDNTYLDLRLHGPHALVGGTTGAGKSEFLQSWIMGMATAYSPQRVTFLFVDYKGGAAFADLVELPHCVGLVTDLSPLLVRRALTSLRAELTYREHLLNRYGAKDLLELERTGNPETPPSLVIIVDEFAALVQEVPDFVDGVVDVAQRGRSLGLHLILATQRPAGVIKDNLRANTNLRVALRMADEGDSIDVIGTKTAASFDPAIPGRAVAKIGPGRLIPFQAGYLGGWTKSEPPRAEIILDTLEFGGVTRWKVPERLLPPRVPETGPTDITRLVDNVIRAGTDLGLPLPRKPWLPELSRTYDLAKLQLSRRDDELAFGVLDDPAEQIQRVVSFQPDKDGNMAVYGASGAGKSTLLRTLAISAGLTIRGGPCFVYGIDFGSRALSALESLPHVGSIIGPDDGERLARLLGDLRAMIDERAVRYARRRAATIGEYRAASGESDEPRVLLLVDGAGAFRNAFEVGPDAHLLDLLESIAADGRPVGVHVVLTADRVGAVTGSLASSMQMNVVLRLTSDNDLVSLDVPSDGFSADTNPGRGFLDKQSVQVAVLGGSSNVADETRHIDRLAARLVKEGVLRAPAVGQLPDHVDLEALLVDAEQAGSSPGSVVFGIGAETLSPVGFDPTIPFVVAGPQRSGRSTAVRTILQALGSDDRTRRFALFGIRRSVLLDVGKWDHVVTDPEEADSLADELSNLIDSGDAGADRLVIVIEDVGEYSRSLSSSSVAELVDRARKAAITVLAEAETADITSYDSLPTSLKRGGQGIVLQPDQGDGDMIFNVDFPRINRREFPVGRGLFVSNGRVDRVQVAVSTVLGHATNLVDRDQHPQEPSSEWWTQ